MLQDIGWMIDRLTEEHGFRSIVRFPVTDPRKVKERVRVTRKKGCPNEFLVTIGRPNYEEREHLKSCIRAKCRPRKFWFRTTPKVKK